MPAQRAELYSKMARDLDERGAAFLRGGETSQSLTLSDLFDTGDDGAIVPRLKVRPFFTHPCALLLRLVGMCLGLGCGVDAELKCAWCCLAGRQPARARKCALSGP